MNEGFNWEDLAKFPEVINKFIDVLSKGLGKAIEPSNIKRLADAKAYENEGLPKNAPTYNLKTH